MFSGTAKLMLSQQTLQLGQSVGCVIPPFVTHSFSGSKDALWIISNIDMNSLPSKIKGLFSVARTFEINDEIAIVKKLAIKILSNYKNESVRINKKNRFLTNLLVELLLELLPSRLTARNRIDLTMIEDYIVENLSNKISISDLAKKCNICPSDFSRLFRDVAGITPYQLIMKKRLEEAKRLLLVNEVAISDVAYQTGFSSQSALTTSFKKIYKTTPLKFRQKG